MVDENIYDHDSLQVLLITMQMNTEIICMLQELKRDFSINESNTIDIDPGHRKIIFRIKVNVDGMSFENEDGVCFQVTAMFTKYGINFWNAIVNKHKELREKLMKQRRSLNDLLLGISRSRDISQIKSIDAHDTFNAIAEHIELIRMSQDVSQNE